jgi:hypothetical protein
VARDDRGQATNRDRVFVVRSRREDPRCAASQTSLRDCRAMLCALPSVPNFCMMTSGQDSLTDPNRHHYRHDLPPSSFPHALSQLRSRDPGLL